MGRKPSSTSELQDKHPLPSGGSARVRVDPQHKLYEPDRDFLKVVDDYPEIVPVARRELDVIESYLGSLLDELLKQ